MTRALPFLAFAAAAFLPFWPAFLLGRTIHPVALVESQLGLPLQQPSPFLAPERPRARVADGLVLLRPHLHRYAGGLRHGELRLWNPDLAFGTPATSDTMLHPFYPPRILLQAALPGDPGLELELFLHLFGSGTTLFLLLCTLGRSRAAAAAGALVWMFWGYSAQWLATGILEGISVFGPLAFRSLVLASRDHRLPGAAAAGGWLGLAVLGSHPQYPLLFLVALLAWIAHQAWIRPGDRPFLARAALVLVLLSAGTGLVSVRSRLDSIESGYRGPDFDTMWLYGDPLRTASYLGTLLLGKVWHAPPAMEFEFAAYLGLAALTLAAAGLRREPFFAVLGLSTLGLAFVAPLARLAGTIPLLSLSPPTRWIFVAGFAAAVLVAGGWDRIAAEGAGRRPALLAAMAGAAFLALAFRPTGAMLETAIGFGLAATAAWLARRHPRMAAGTAFAALGMDLLPPFLLATWHADPAVLSRIPPPLAIPSPPAPWRALGVLGTGATTTRSAEWEADAAAGNNLLALWGVESAGGFESILPDVSTAYARAAGAVFNPAGRSLVWSRFDSPLLDAANVERLYLPPGFSPGPNWEKIARAGRVEVWHNRRALPRARLLGRVRQASDPADALRLLGEIDLGLEAVVEVPIQTAGAAGSVAWVRRESDLQVLRVEAPQPTLLLVSDTHDPGWKARVDGIEVPVHRANLAFRAVEIPAGTHEVNFRYEPDWLGPGLAGSLAFGLLALGWPLLARRRT